MIRKQVFEGKPYWYSTCSRQWYHYANALHKHGSLVPNKRIIKELNKLKAIKEL